MSDERWIIVRHWNEFQHYRDRDPLWIKNYVALLSDDDYLALPPGTRAVLHGLWLAYASSHGRVRVDTGSLTRRLSMRVTSQQLKALNDAGFIEFSASKPLALTRSREKEKEKDNPPTPFQTKGGTRKMKLRGFTGVRVARGSHGITHVRDPLGTDPPPFGWKYPRPTKEEVRAALTANGRVDVPGHAESIPIVEPDA